MSFIRTALARARAPLALVQRSAATMRYIIAVASMLRTSVRVPILAATAADPLFLVLFL